MKETGKRPQVTLEDLLRLKRAERPTAEFWPEFDRQLHRKQLAAIVETRPRWKSWLQAKTVSRVCLPLGATAALAFAIGSVRGTFYPARPQVTATPAVSTAPAVAVVTMPESAARIDLDAAGNALAQIDVSPQVAAVDEAPRATASPTAAPEQVAVLDAKKSDAPSNSAIVANLAMTMGTAPAIAKVLGDASSLVSVETPAAVEPLTQIATPRDSRRQRLLAYAVTSDPHAPDSASATGSRERITRRLSDEALYDSMSRLGLTGQSVSIKF